MQSGYRAVLSIFVRLKLALYRGLFAVLRAIYLVRLAAGAAGATVLRTFPFVMSHWSSLAGVTGAGVNQRIIERDHKRQQ
jgi:hypothetical protein